MIDERAEISVDRARLLEKLGRYRAALVTTARALKECPDPNVAGHLRLARATIRNFQGRWRDCLEQCHQLLADDLGDDRRVPAQAHLLAEWCCACLGLPGSAEHDRTALALMTELDDSIGLANLHLNRGVSAWRECPRPRCHRRLPNQRRALPTAQATCWARRSPENNLAEVLTLQYQLDEAERILERVHRVTRSSNYPHGALTTVSGLSRIAAWRGDISEALRLQSEALQGFRDLDADDLAIDSMVRMVEIHVLAGDAAEALAAADEAAEAMARLGDVPVTSATLARLRARALLLAGRHDEAQASFDRALDLADAGWIRLRVRIGCDGHRPDGR